MIINHTTKGLSRRTSRMTTILAKRKMAKMNASTHVRMKTVKRIMRLRLMS